MRLSIACLALMGALVTGGGLAVAQPPGVTEKNGAWVAPDGKPLYTFVKDMAGASACIERCAVAWPPLLAPAGAATDREWTIITRPEGSKQWAYKGKPLYTYRADAPGQAATGVGPAWPLAVK